MKLKNGDEIAAPHITMVCHHSSLAQSSPFYLGLILGSMKLIFLWHRMSDSVTGVANRNRRIPSSLISGTRGVHNFSLHQYLTCGFVYSGIFAIQILLFFSLDSKWEPDCFPPITEECLKTGTPEFCHTFFLGICGCRLYLSPTSSWEDKGLDWRYTINQLDATIKKRYRDISLLHQHLPSGIMSSCDWEHALRPTTTRVCWHWNIFLQFLFLLQMKYGLAPSGSFSIQSSWSLERKMQPITTPEATTPLARKALIWCWTVSVSW